MHIADVDQGMLGANSVGTLAVPFGQIAAVSTGDGPVTIARQSQQIIGDVTADIGGSATSTVTGNVSKAIASLGMASSAKNVRIGQAGVGMQVTDSFTKMAYAMLMPVVIPCALAPAVIGAFVVLAVTSRALDLSALIGLLMLRGIVVTTAIVLLALVQHKIEAGPNIITGSSVSLQVTALPDAVIAVSIWIAYSVGGGLFGVAIAAAAMGNDWPRTWASTSASSA